MPYSDTGLEQAPRKENIPQEHYWSFRNVIRQPLFPRTQLLMFPWPSLTYPSRVTVQKYQKTEFVLTGQCKPVFPKGISVFCEKVFLLSITTILHCLNFASSCLQHKLNFTSVLFFILRGPSHLIIFPLCDIKQRVVERQSVVIVIFYKASMSDPLLVLLIDIFPCLPTSSYQHL